MQARARFIIQLREPLSRHVSYLHMKIRANHTQLSVQRISEIDLYHWEAHTANRPELLAMMAMRPDVRECNSAPLSTRKSPKCAATATKAASLAAQLVSNCIILPFREDQLGSETAAGSDPITIGECIRSNYPPVRPHTRPAASAARRLAATQWLVSPLSRLSPRCPAWQLFRTIPSA